MHPIGIDHPYDLPAPPDRYTRTAKLPEFVPDLLRQTLCRAAIAGLAARATAQLRYVQSGNGARISTQLDWNLYVQKL